MRKLLIACLLVLTLAGTALANRYIYINNDDLKVAKKVDSGYLMALYCMGDGTDFKIILSPGEFIVLGKHGKLDVIYNNEVITIINVDEFKNDE